MTSRRKIALLLVDVINSFFDPGEPNYYPGAEDVLPVIATMLRAARQHGHLVIHAAERHRTFHDDFEWKKLPIHHLEGDPSTDFVTGFEPAGPAEAVIYKRRYSAFFATDLALFLHEQNVTHLIIVGVKTNCCIRATVQDAFAHGFTPIVPREATSSNRPHLAEASLEDIARYFGEVVSATEAEKMLG
ncbi:isochorismatase hydrolase [Gluconacetobacter diazotrophicus PA1 5]|uniref:Cysteine hydrolase n=2 Tax=Gluconacetobacter diazotrophicus TaxID=33996 RepID=A0A7W4I8D3_GLUDI|nr:isochorismatase family cysteine hydrolase [Gluconacetobacter diazotrophicus]ACI50694.1 isochorismatase hydrolase [Gluconacetobacter diazotrophicus PA1 5]MBB2158147.1 cysteine hydrolase [Gluconacetobacter diazotrophicus]TWA99896.1 nicotinamidase-related amidase [Gluconacetobacter diazotrophicus]CAP56637.1 putative isochorismatase family protein rutB [Gluconacetobacter diazotrophicus PA1 5]